MNQIELFKNYRGPDLWIRWSNILQNINETELCFGQFDQSKVQTNCNTHINKLMKQTNPFCKGKSSARNRTRKSLKIRSLEQPLILTLELYGLGFGSPEGLVEAVHVDLDAAPEAVE